MEEVRRVHPSSLFVSRPKKSMNYRRNILTFMALLSLSVGTAIATQQVNAASDPFMDFFNKDCVPQAQKAGMTKAEAQQGCNCTIGTLRKKYSSPAFTGLLTKYRSGDANAKKTLTTYGQTCFEEILDNVLFDN
jgi:hypothetical protein